MFPLQASILIPVRDDLEGLEVTLRSIIDAGVKRPETEIIVCNDGGGSAVGALAAKYGCREARLETNRGSYAVRNAGLEKARGRVIAFVDADQRVDAGWLDAGIAGLATADYVGGKIVVEGPEASDVWERYDAAAAFPVEWYLSEMHFVPTANLFVRRDVVEQVGTFRGDLQSGGDREFGERVYRAGLVQQFCPAAITYHPARNRREQFERLRRVGRGTAEVRINIWRERPLSLFFESCWTMLRVAPELLWRLARYVSLSWRDLKPDELVFIMIAKLSKAVLHYHVSSRALGLALGRDEANRR